MEADRANGLLSEAQYQTAKLELEARLADDALSLEDTAEPAVSAAANSLHPGRCPARRRVRPLFLAGQSGLADSPRRCAIRCCPVRHGWRAGEHDFMKMLQKVEEKTKTNPDDGAAWAMLAKTYGVMERWPEALQAYEKAIKLLPAGCFVLSGYAEALALTTRVLTGKPIELVQKALEIDPQDMKGLELAGIHAYQEQNFAQAGFYFKRLYPLLRLSRPMPRTFWLRRRKRNVWPRPA